MARAELPGTSTRNVPRCVLAPCPACGYGNDPAGFWRQALHSSGPNIGHGHMPHLRTLVLALIMVISVVPIGAIAQSSAPPQSPSQITNPSGAAAPPPKQTVPDRIRKWSRARWQALKEYWSKSKKKWDDCVRQSEARKMSIHEKTHFIDRCMQQ